MCQHLRLSVPVILPEKLYYMMAFGCMPVWLKHLNVKSFFDFTNILLLSEQNILNVHFRTRDGGSKEYQIVE